MIISMIICTEGNFVCVTNCKVCVTVQLSIYIYIYIIYIYIFIHLFDYLLYNYIIHNL